MYFWCLTGQMTVSDFLQKVAVKIMAKWRQFGLAMELRPADLDAIAACHPSDLLGCFVEVVSTWESLHGPLTREKVAEVLESPLLGECVLAHELRT